MGSITGAIRNDVDPTTKLECCSCDSTFSHTFTGEEILQMNAGTYVNVVCPSCEESCPYLVEFEIPDPTGEVGVIILTGVDGGDPVEAEDLDPPAEAE